MTSNLQKPDLSKDTTGPFVTRDGRKAVYVALPKPLDDALQAWTIGFNNFQNDDDATWKFVGWDWSQDVFVQGRGKPIGWLPWDNPEPAALQAAGGA